MRFTISWRIPWPVNLKRWLIEFLMTPKLTPIVSMKASDATELKDIAANCHPSKMRSISLGESLRAFGRVYAGIEYVVRWQRLIKSAASTLRRCPRSRDWAFHCRAEELTGPSYCHPTCEITGLANLGPASAHEFRLLRRRDPYRKKPIIMGTLYRQRSELASANAQAGTDRP